MSLTFAHQAPFDELSLPTDGFEEVSRNDDAVIALSSMVPSDKPAGMGPTKRNVHWIYFIYYITALSIYDRLLFNKL